MKMQTRRQKEDPEINLISLIDIALLLVIFFMLTSTFMQEGRLKIELPQASLVPANKQKSDPIVVSVITLVIGVLFVHETRDVDIRSDTLEMEVATTPGDVVERANVDAPARPG